MKQSFDEAIKCYRKLHEEMKKNNGAINFLKLFLLKTNLQYQTSCNNAL